MIFDEDQLALKEAAARFARDILLPGYQKREQVPIDRDLCREMGAMGFLGTDLPVDIGGLGTSSITTGMLAEELAKQSLLLALPGNLLMKGGPEDYIGAVLCLRGTLYFKEAHTPLVREALCQCFDEFKRIAEPHLTWLWREEPPEGKPLTAYSDAKSLREMLASMDEDYPLSFYYTSGKQ